MSKVTGGSEKKDVWTRIKILLGFEEASPSSEDDEDGDDDEVQDYILEKSSDNPDVNANATSLTRLNNDTVFEGSALFAFAAVGTERGWKERDMEGLQELKRILMNV
jgi:hypothetical protein